MSSDKPWFAPEKKNSRSFGRGSKTGALSFFQKVSRVVHVLQFFSTGLFAALLFCAAGVIAHALIASSYTGMSFGLGILVMATVFLLGCVFVARQVGKMVAKVSPMHSNESHFALSIKAAHGDVSIEENKVRPLPAPELALQQFILQVRAYATEKAYQRLKPSDKTTQPGNITKHESADLLKRRWEEVLDSLNEFELYLAGDPAGVVEKLTAKYPCQVVDVSQVFREVAESFDNTWRRKGINIETAIVTPLRANTNEVLLRRLLVGPWRASAYFARRGNGVVFSAKSLQGKVIARWECDGLNIPENYLEFAMDSSRSVNERIETGMQVIANDPASSNTLNALISLITWIDLAQACQSDFSFKNTNDGFVIELNLK